MFFQIFKSYKIKKISNLTIDYTVYLKTTSTVNFFLFIVALSQQLFILINIINFYLYINILLQFIATNYSFYSNFSHKTISYYLFK